MRESLKIWLFCLLLSSLFSLNLPAQAQNQAKPDQSAGQIFTKLKGRAFYSPDGHYLVSYQNTQIDFWDTKGEVFKRQLRFSGAIHSLNFTPDGRHLAVSSGQGVYEVFRLPAFKKIAHLTEAAEGMVSYPFALSPDGQYLSLVHIDSQSSQIKLQLRVWHVPSQRRIQALRIGSFANPLPGHFPSVGLAYHPLGQFLSTALEWPNPETPRDLMVYDIQRGRWRYWLPGSPPLAYSQNGRYFAYLSLQAKDQWRIRLWHTPSKLLKTLPQAIADPQSASLSLSPQGDQLAFLGPAHMNHRQLTVLSTASLKVLLEVQLPEAVDTLSFHSSARSLVASSLSNPEFRPRRYDFKR